MIDFFITFAAFVTGIGFAAYVIKHERFQARQAEHECRRRSLKFDYCCAARCQDLRTAT